MPTRIAATIAAVPCLYTSPHGWACGAQPGQGCVFADPAKHDRVMHLVHAVRTRAYLGVARKRGGQPVAAPKGKPVSFRPAPQLRVALEARRVGEESIHDTAARLLSAAITDGE